MNKDERLAYLKSLGERDRAAETVEERGKRLFRLRQRMMEAEKLVEVDPTIAYETESKHHTEIAVVEAKVFNPIPVSPSEIQVAVAEELDAFKEEQKDNATASEALTADEK